MSAFVVGFLCLNFAGALCLTYCLQSSQVEAADGSDAHLSEHCRRIKREAEQNNSNASAEAAQASCCMMPAIMFAAPLEKAVKLSPVPVAILSQQVVEPILVETLVAISSLTDIPVYRPPPLDRRVDRLKNCVIRI